MAVPFSLSVKNMKKKLKKTSAGKIDIIMTVSFLTLYISIAVFFNGDERGLERTGDRRPFNSGWVSDAGVPAAVIPQKMPVAPGDVLRIENTLPEIGDDEFLQYYSSRSEIKVFLEDRLLFCYPQGEGGGDPVNKLLFIPLEREYSHKRISIETTSPYRKYSGRINGIFIAGLAGIVQGRADGSSSMFFLYVVCITIGAMIILIYFFIPNHKDYMSWLYLGSFCILLSLQYIGEYNLSPLFCEDARVVNAVYFYSSLLVPPALLACFAGATRRRKLLMTTAAVFAFLAVSAVLLNALGRLPFSASLYYYKIICFIFYSIIMVAVFFEAMIYGDPRLITVFLASLILLITAGIETVSHFYFLMSYWNAGLIQGSGLISYMLIMIVAPVYSGVGKIESNLALKNELVEKRIQLMISQIRPHFIYNTLNSIQALISVDPKKSEEMLDDFSHYLRAHIDVIEGDEVILFSEEINNIKTYVNIEQVRFPRLKVEYLIEEDLFMVPALSIQPIVENAVKHGVSKRNRGGTVTIASRCRDNKYVVVVSDDGAGFDSGGGSDHHSVGMENVKSRLVAICHADMTVESRIGAGTTVTIEIPKEDAIEDDFS